MYVNDGVFATVRSEFKQSRYLFQTPKPRPDWQRDPMHYSVEVRPKTMASIDLDPDSSFVLKRALGILELTLLIIALAQQGLAKQKHYLLRSL